MVLDPLEVSYSQVTVFDSSLERPFSFWTEKHVSQGFAWRPGSASFRTIEESGLHSMEIIVSNDDPEISADAQRVIEVPFEIPSSGEIEVAGISDNRALSLPPGTYALQFECSSDENTSSGKIRFIFIKSINPKFRLLRADSDLSCERELLLTATPA